MCRLIGVVASEPTEFTLSLKDAPRSLAALSRQHGDGWGVAVYDALGNRQWRIHRGIDTAHQDGRFHAVADAERGELMVAHVRRRTVGPVSIENTHPFRVGRWVFAHNGTVEDLRWVRAGVSPERLAGVIGSTDSELFFAWLLTRLDEEGLADEPATDATDRVLARAMDRVRAEPGAGAITFLMSDGETLYARRWGRTLHVLERGPRDPVRTLRESVQEGVAVGTVWSQRRRAILVASEALTSEPWWELAEGALLRIDREGITLRPLS